MVEYPEMIYARVVNPGMDDEYMITGDAPEDVDEALVGPGESVSSIVARYVLKGYGGIHHSAPVYVEDTQA